jgi:hypothetical protein
MRQTYKVVRRESLGPIESDAPHRVPPPQPPGEPKPALDAYVLLALWKRARTRGDLPTARAWLAELERLAERPNPRAGGEGDRDDTDE